MCCRAPHLVPQAAEVEHQQVISAREARASGGPRTGDKEEDRRHAKRDRPVSTAPGTPFDRSVRHGSR